jgi:isopenicillin N synthase-like dioxygenase
LQVEVSPDRWIDATPLAGSFVVNIGELLELGNQRLSACNGAPGGFAACRPAAAVDRFFPRRPAGCRVPVYTLPDELAREALGPDSDPQIRCCARWAGIT